MIIDVFMALVRLALGPGGMPVIPWDDNGPREEKPYATVRLMPGAPQPVHRGSVGEDGSRPLAAHRAITLQVQVYGPDAYGLADLLGLQLTQEAVLDMAEAVNVAWHSQPRVSDVPALMDEHTYEERAILELDAAYTTEFIEQVGVIETVEVTMATAPGTIEEVQFTATVGVAPDEP